MTSFKVDENTLLFATFDYISYQKYDHTATIITWIPIIATV